LDRNACALKSDCLEFNTSMERPMELAPYLLFNGNCQEAFKFYERCLGGKIVMMMAHGESPMADKVSPEWRKKIIHTRMQVGDDVLMGSDAPPEHFSPAGGFSVSLSVEKPSDAERIFKALSENGKVSMPMQKTFWAERFGMLVDQFGQPWMINCE